MSLSDDVRAASAEIAAGARLVRVDLDALDALDPGAPPVLDAERHYLEGEPADVATYVLALESINFGSGWFPTLRKRRGSDGNPVSGYFTVAWGLADRFRYAGAWTAGELRAMRTEEIADVLGQRRDHELMALFAQALRQLGAFLDGRTALDAIAAADGSAVRLAEQLANGMPMFRDHGFYKRAQIVPSDLELAGVAAFGDIDRLTIFADNLVPHVLRCDGVLRYDDALAEHIDSGRLLPSGPAEREIRACAVHACARIARRTGMTERDVDNALWTRGGARQYKAIPRHRTRTIFY
jgi:Potential Queuosine, Q, salvage protein family